MGHDITAYDKKTDKEVYLRMSMNEGTLISHLYNALDSQECNGGCSGYGVEKEFTAEQMKLARDKYLYYKEEYLEPDKRGEEMRQFLAEKLFPDGNVVVEIVQENEQEIDFTRLDEFFNEAQGDDFVIYFG